MAIKKGKRELIDTGTDKRYVKRSQDGSAVEEKHGPYDGCE